ncbi:MAG: CDP-diacylglycerol--glycerol-3-phosphate 3-phosphatidyltransferase [Spirochaetes bacterium]|nr:CDP-diacylglycerol--glycerol-3-phosphate 3-phosphatidyltransferase [Brevinematales bacterium]MCL1958935.1 CDP-diacylglycerol--glycerol-3-phosphate 3-phosphatidyltransferase [Spirochaetota bacterium]
MTLANKLTSLRVILTPVFFIVYFLPGFFPSWFSFGSAWTIPVLWLIFIFSEITDLLDGLVARKLNQTSDLGKLFDPFADTLMQITCFLCFVIDGIFPAILFLIVIYREFGILFIRNLMLKKGISLGARKGGKIKTVAYIIAGGAALLTVSLQRLKIFDFLFPYFKTGALVFFIIAIIISIISFIDYLIILLKAENAAK